MDVNLVAQSFTAKVQLEASWVDADLASVDLKEHPPEWRDVGRRQRAGVLKLRGIQQHFFAPRLEFKNCIKVDEDSSNEWYKIYPGETDNDLPVVCFRWDLTADFHTSFELFRFPMDSQKLDFVLLTGWEGGASVRDAAKYSVRLKKNQSGNYRSFCAVESSYILSEYELSDKLHFVEGWTDKKESAQELEYSMLSMELHIERKAGFWLHHLVLPLFIITTCLLFGYAIKQEHFADRSQITLTLLLSQVGFKYVVAGMLPKLSYATLIDQYVMACVNTQAIILGSIKRWNF